MKYISRYYDLTWEWKTETRGEGKWSTDWEGSLVTLCKSCAEMTEGEVRHASNADEGDTCEVCGANDIYEDKPALTHEFNPVPVWQRKRWPELIGSARRVPAGLEPKEGCTIGCGDPCCDICYAPDKRKDDRPDRKDERFTDEAIRRYFLRFTEDLPETACDGVLIQEWDQWEAGETVDSILEWIDERHSKGVAFLRENA